MIYAKRIVRCLVFITGLIGLLTASSFVFQPKNNMSEFGMEEVSANGILGEKEHSIDVLVLGDSESYSSIIPLQIWKDTGYTSYVCGSPAQSLDYSQVLLHRTFEKQSPKIVILETNAIYRPVSDSSAAIAKLADHFSVFQYHDRWKSLGWHDFTGKSKFTWTDDYKGYRYNARVLASTKKDHMVKTETKAEIPELNIKYIEEIKEFCDENGAKLVFLSTPSTVNWNYERHNGIQNLADEIGCEYIDLNLMNEQLKINWEEDTRDKGDHLNHFGAAKVTRFISNYLTETGLLTDHRPDADYAKWNDSLSRYESVVKNA